MSSINVITAGPSAGKSSTIRDLSANGYRTLPEAARILFDQRISEGIDPETVKQSDQFHKQVEKIDRRIEEQLQTISETVFLDRSLADNIAYRKHFGNDSPAVIDELRDETEDRYDNVFILERIDFEDDSVRTEDEAEATQIHNQLVDVYENMINANVFHVELMPVDKRTAYITERTISVNE